MVQNNLGVMVFAATGAGEAGLEFSSYTYTAILAAAGTTYSPPADTFFRWHAVDEASVDVNLEIYDIAWQPWLIVSSEADMIYQEGNQYTRLINDDPSNTIRIRLIGVTFTSGFSGYTYTENLAGAATYSPPADTFFRWRAASEGSSNVNLEIYDIGWLPWLLEGKTTGLVHQENNQFTRLINDSGSAIRIRLIGGTLA